MTEYRLRAPNHFVGYHQVLGILQEWNDASYSESNYPPHNIIKTDESNLILELAIAGYKKDEIKVDYENDILTIKTDRKVPVYEKMTAPTADGLDKDSYYFNNGDSDVEYIHKGISNKSFMRKFQLNENVVVNDAEMKDGLLRIKLEIVLPEGKKPKSIKIN